MFGCGDGFWLAISFRHGVHDTIRDTKQGESWVVTRLVGATVWVKVLVEVM